MNQFSTSAAARGRRTGLILAACVLLAGMPMQMAVAGPPDQAADMAVSQAYQELFDMSMKEKKGLTFFVKGQSIPGIVTSVGQYTVEARNQIFGRIIIRIERIDAIAIN